MMWIFSIRFVNPCKLSKFLLGIISTYSVYMSTWNVIENRIVKRETFTCTCVRTWLLLLLQSFCLYIAFVKLQATFWHNSSWALVRSRNSENEKRNWHLSFNSLLPHKILILYEKLRRNKNKNKPSFHGHWIPCMHKKSSACRQSEIRITYQKWSDYDLVQTRRLFFHIVIAKRSNGFHYKQFQCSTMKLMIIQRLLQQYQQ